MFAAERYADAKLRTDAEKVIGSTFHLQMNLLRSYISMLERVCETEVLAISAADCGVRSSSEPATPHNDSGFCSGVSSPESCGKKDLECSPPKVARII
ncbi:hypothetical protein KIN20_035436 [Parelaphostrongylus tenuis]|uniref:Uncharacterized protein n=1 Tax=Parelaphostrongylus tenuis TaxID=148309 RepID=A0AAD5RBF4_PARTN|nr:hypothetical protein KIN20_035436 [Parelaphostrongylus tenuis]